MKLWMVYSRCEGWPRQFVSKHKSERAAVRAMRKQQRECERSPTRVLTDAKRWLWGERVTTFGVLEL